MTSNIILATISTLLITIVVLFQLALAAGMPWGAASMGGKFPGKYPPKMRLVAVLNALILIFINILILVRLGLIFDPLLPFSNVAIWFVVVFFLAGTIVNTITPSKIERIWAPVNLVLLIATIIIALS